MQQLMGKLTEHKYIEFHRNNEDSDVVTDLVWAHPTSIKLLRSFPHVLIMDCTYKTNRYRMPLLEIFGVTSTDMTFSVCFAYMEAERENNYTWCLGVLCSLIGEDTLPDVIVTDREMALLNAINTVFPNATHLLCKWHINKNVLANCKKLFETKEKWDKFILYWNMLVHASTEEEYIDHLRRLNLEFTTYPAAFQYVKESWLDEYKERFVSTWADKCMHFGNTTSNRAESSHLQLKRQLGSSQGTFETNWAKTQSLLELQHTNIKASFEKSKTIVQHSFKPSEFKELRGNISRNALERILEETKRSNLVGIDIIACGCIIRSAHGLPCTHEIATYVSEGRPIPLKCIHPHWVKLDMNPNTGSSSTMELDCRTKLELLQKQFNEFDQIRKLQLLKKMRELSKPDSTFLLELEVKSRTCGRPRSRIETSTKREPSAFELVQFAQDSHLPNPIMVKAPLEQKNRKKEKLRVVRIRSKNARSYSAQFSKGLRPFIHLIKDVAADGNCGFRAIAALIGHTEDGWRQVRRELLHELLNHVEHYKQLYGVENRVEELIETLSYYEDNPSYRHWLTMPDMGYLIAFRYNLVLFHFSMAQCLTFLPLRSPPLPVSTRLEIAIHFVNSCNFVQVLMLSDHPVPPIANKWKEFRHPCASQWELA